LAQTTKLTWVQKFWKHVAEVGVPLTIYEIFNRVYDWGFYPFAIWYLGYIWGSLVATLGSFVSCAVLYYLYDVMKVDWLRANAARSLSNKANNNTFEKFFAWIGSPKKTLRDRVAGVSLFIALNWAVDPLIVAIFFKQKHFEGLTTKDWLIFLASVTTANLIWVAQIASVIVGLKWLISPFLIE
jgi:hypothetical protein